MGISRKHIKAEYDRTVVPLIEPSFELLKDKREAYLKTIRAYKRATSQHMRDEIGVHVTNARYQWRLVTWMLAPI
jgi:hypothetical protein